MTAGTPRLRRLLTLAEVVLKVWAKIIGLISAAGIALTGCTQPASLRPTDLPQPGNYLDSAVIYEVNIRQFTEEGTFDAFREHLPRLESLGVDILWLMPIHPISEKNRKGTLGSYYSVADYLAVNPEFGTEQDFRELVDEAHQRGFKVILDWVANHTGWDNPWITDHPDWYTQDASGNIIHPAGTDWTDVADLNYNSLDMRLAMIDAMKYWVTEFDVDGYRADVAGQVPSDFWEAARAAIEQEKPVFMLAEDSGNQGLLKTAFDANYGWTLLGELNSMARGTSNATKFRLKLRSLQAQYRDGAFAMNFITNHDENSWNGTEFERMGDNVKLAAVLAFTAPGMPLIYTGQEIGLDRQLKFFEKDPVEWPAESAWGTSDWEVFYKKLVDLKHYNPALWTNGAGGRAMPFKTSEKYLVAFHRQVDGNTVVVLANPSDTAIEAKLNWEELAGTYTEHFTGELVELVPGDGPVVGPHGYLVLTD